LSIADAPGRAYDSGQLDRELAETGVEMMAPHRSNHTNLTQDGRPLVAIVTAED
jgi:hypothetical protein